MKTVLHVGIHKTGTTTIQHFANRNARKLRIRGLWYPSYDLIGETRRYAHHDFAHAVAGSIGAALTLDQAKAFVAAIARQGAQMDKVLLSAEPIYRHLIIDGKSEDGSEAYWARREAYWEGREAYLAKLADVMAVLEPEILIVLRRQDDFARSLYQENVKAKNIQSDFRSFIRDRIHFFQYDRQIEIFQRYFKKVDVLIFEDLIKRGTFVRDFFDHLGVNFGKFSRMNAVPDLNESLPMELVEFKRLLNASNLSKKQFASVSRILLDVAKRAKPFFNHSALDARDWSPPAEMAAFMEQFEEANERIFDALPVKPDRGTLFPPARPRTEVFEGLSQEQIMTINALVLRQLLSKVAA